MCVRCKKASQLLLMPQSHIWHVKKCFPAPLPTSSAFCVSACCCSQDFSKTERESKRGLMIPALFYFSWLQLVWIFPLREHFCTLRKNKSTGGRNDTSSRNEANRVYTHDTYKPVTFKRYGLWYFKTKKRKRFGRMMNKKCCLQQSDHPKLGIKLSFSNTQEAASQFLSVKACHPPSESARQKKRLGTDVTIAQAMCQPV